jgi:prophage regulatory protein
MSEIRLLRLAEVAAQVGLGKTKIYEMIRSGDFPEPMKVGKASRWRNTEVSRWIEASRE